MVAGELEELLDTAIYREIAAQALYLAAQKKTDDPGARALLKELAEQEFNHSKMVKKLREEKLYDRGWRQENVSNLMISEYLTAPDIYEGAGLQDTFIYALKREEQSAQFYTHMMSILQGEDAKRLCHGLANEELNHKLKLELLYEDLFLKED